MGYATGREEGKVHSNVTGGFRSEGWRRKGKIVV